MRTLIALAGTAVLFGAVAVAEDPASTYCNFADNNQVTIQYSSVVKEEPHNGKVWSPGATLYVETPLTLGGTPLPLGAYSVHFIPDKKTWTIIVNKNVTAGAAYDSAQDLARARMQLGELPAPQKELQLTFGHMAPKVCNLRVNFQKTGAFTDFLEN